MSDPIPTPTELDEALDPLGEVVAGFGAIDALDPTGAMRLDHLALELPIELEVLRVGEGLRDGEGLRLGAAPPTQYVETSILPVFHRIRLRIERDADG